MPRSRKDIRSLLAIFGVVILLATTVITLGTIRPTEATWQDTVHGASTFGTHENAGKNYARAISGYGIIERSRTTDLGPARAFAYPSEPAVEEPLDIDNSGALGVLPIRAVGNSCATVRPGQAPYCDVGENLPPGASSAASGVTYLRLWAAAIRGVENIAFGSEPDEDDDSISATAICVPGERGQASVTADGPIVLRGDTALYLPPPNHQTSAFDRTTGSFLGIRATMQYHQIEEPGWARAEARLYVNSNDLFANWTTHIVLASAECGIARDTPGEPQRPTTSRPTALPEVANQPSTRGASTPARSSIVSDVELGPLPENTLDSDLADGETGSEVDADQDEASLPTLDDAADAERTDDEEAASGDATTTRVASPSRTPATATPTTATTEPEARESTTYAPETGNTEPTSSAQPEPTSSPQAPAGPQKLQDVRVGREFAVTTREGVELGAARIEDVTRLPDCGVEITLEITTSAEDGPERWASIDHRDFAEVRPGGSTRPAQRASSECAGPAATAPAQLRVGDVHEVVVVIQISDAADRAIFRPEGTAGWRFDLPPLPTTTATAPATTTAAGETAAARPSPPAPATTHASASPQESAVASAP